MVFRKRHTTICYHNTNVLFGNVDKVASEEEKMNQFDYEYWCVATDEEKGLYWIRRDR